MKNNHRDNGQEGVDLYLYISCSVWLAYKVLLKTSQRVQVLAKKFWPSFSFPKGGEFVGGKVFFMSNNNNFEAEF